jgi:hypothetical protein
VLDEIGREEEERADAELEPEGFEWKEDRLEAVGVTPGGTVSATRNKDVAQALNRSESCRRVRKLRQKQPTVTKRPRTNADDGAVVWHLELRGQGVRARHELTRASRGGRVRIRPPEIAFVSIMVIRYCAVCGSH